MKMLILGGTGMLGHKLYQTTKDPIDSWVTVRGEANSLAKFSFYCPDRVIGGVEATNLDSVRKAMTIVKPDVLVNCVGIVKQQPLGNDPIACLTINSLLPHQLANLCAEFGSRLIHISTDCVFDGKKGSYTEKDLTNAEDLYGRSKALGETSAPHAITLRTSIIGRELSTGFGLVEWFLSQRGKAAKGFNHAFFSGLTTNELSRVIQSVALEHKDMSGIYQVSTTPIDKHALLELMNTAFETEVTISQSDELKIDRTLNSTLFRSLTNYEPSTWPEMIREIAADSTPYEFWRNH
jgi:dTDP-4-dehydrorhamnose reductase